MRFLFIFFLMCSTAWASPINKKYSGRTFPFHNLSFKNEPAKDFNDSEIVGSGFYQEWVEGDTEVVKDIFPDGMIEVTFINCNLDNVYVPVGNTVDPSCTNKKIKVQNDREDWVLDNSLKPTTPLHPKRYDDLGLSKDPKDISPTKLDEPLIFKTIEEKENEALAATP